MGGVWEKGFVIYTISNTMTKGHFVIHRIFCEVPQKNANYYKIQTIQISRQTENQVSITILYESKTYFKYPII